MGGGRCDKIGVMDDEYKATCATCYYIRDGGTTHTPWLCYRYPPGHDGRPWVNQDDCACGEYVDNTPNGFSSDAKKIKRN